MMLQKELNHFSSKKRFKTLSKRVESLLTYKCLRTKDLKFCLKIESLHTQKASMLSKKLDTRRLKIKTIFDKIRFKC